MLWLLIFFRSLGSFDKDIISTQITTAVFIGLGFMFFKWPHKIEWIKGQVPAESKINIAFSQYLALAMSTLALIFSIVVLMEK